MSHKFFLTVTALILAACGSRQIDPNSPSLLALPFDTGEYTSKCAINYINEQPNGGISWGMAIMPGVNNASIRCKHTKNGLALFRATPISEFSITFNAQAAHVYQFKAQGDAVGITGWIEDTTGQKQTSEARGQRITDFVAGTVIMTR